MKNKTLITLTLLAINLASVIAQPVYSTKTGTASFYSKAPLEDIEATSSALNSFINTSNGDVVFVVAITSFKFQKALMQEHFNENYMESGMYKTATYKGKINEPLDFTRDGEYIVTTTGTLNMHGVDNSINEKGTITVKDGKATLKSTFKIKLEEYKIKIPRVVVENIAEVVDVNIEAAYTPHVIEKK
ncbi:MAG: YceI family protein [Bacteroidetes bacterium]|nr:YceI family protein [Bacteroidota bacterium]